MTRRLWQSPSLICGLYISFQINLEFYINSYRMCPTFIWRFGLNRTAFLPLANSPLFLSGLGFPGVHIHTTFRLHVLILHQDTWNARFQSWRCSTHLCLPSFQKGAAGLGGGRGEPGGLGWTLEPRFLQSYRGCSFPMWA